MSNNIVVLSGSPRKVDGIEIQAFEWRLCTRQWRYGLRCGRNRCIFFAGGEVKAEGQYLMK